MSSLFLGALNQPGRNCFHTYSLGSHGWGYSWPLPRLQLTCPALQCNAQVLSGAVVASGEMEAEVTAIGGETFFGKTIALLGAPEEKGHLFKVSTQLLSTYHIPRDTSTGHLPSTLDARHLSGSAGQH